MIAAVNECAGDIASAFKSTHTSTAHASSIKNPSQGLDSPKINVCMDVCSHWRYKFPLPYYITMPPQGTLSWLPDDSLALFQQHTQQLKQHPYPRSTALNWTSLRKRRHASERFPSHPPHPSHALCQTCQQQHSHAIPQWSCHPWIINSKGRHCNECMSCIQHWHALQHIRIPLWVDCSWNIFALGAMEEHLQRNDAYKSMLQIYVTNLCYKSMLQICVTNLCYKSILFVLLL